MNPMLSKALVEVGITLATEVGVPAFKDLAIPAMKNSVEQLKNKFDKPIELSENRDVGEKYDFDKPIQLSENRSIVDENVKTDDNGKGYRIGDELQPNNTYEVNGYKYTTDENGRIVSAEGKLQPKNHEGRFDMEDSMEAIGKGDQRPTDDRGHLIGDQFNGVSALENLVPQDAKINRNEVKDLECSLASEVKNGGDVYLKVEPHYSDDSVRPDSFAYTYTVNGETSVKIFRNGE